MRVGRGRVASLDVVCLFQESLPCGLVGSSSPPSPVLLTCLLHSRWSQFFNTLDYSVFEEFGKPVAEMATPWPLLVDGDDHPAFLGVVMGEAGERSRFHWEFHNPLSFSQLDEFIVGEQVPVLRPGAGLC